MRRITPGSRITGVLAVIVLALGGTLVAAAPAHAADAPTLNAPSRIYPIENTTMAFSGTDPVSGEGRTISVANTTEDRGGCDDVKATNYSPANCPEIDLALSTGRAGLLLVPNVITKSDSADQVDHLVAPSGAIVTASGGDDGTAGVLYDLSGTQSQLNAALGTLEFVPADSYREKDLAVNDGDLPALELDVINGDGGSDATADVQIKVEGTNQAPAILVHQAALASVVNQTADFIDDADVTDPELCTQAICGSPYANTTPIGDPNSSMLLAAWLDNNCGTFNFQGADFAANGSASNNSIDTLLLNSLLDDNADNGYNPAQRAAIEASINPAALDLDLTQEAGTASQDTTVFAGIGTLDNVDYALSHIEYTGPATPGTCHLNVTVSDLGNLGMPTSFTSSTNPKYEVPDALGDSTQITFDVHDTHPHVTVEQTPAGSAPGVDPTHTSANYAITFDQPVDEFDGTELSTASSDSGMGVSCNVVPVTPGTVYDASCIASHDGTIRVSVPAGEAYAQGHTGDSAYNSLASTSTDNAVTWDTTAPTVTIDPAPSQSSPAVGFPVVYQVGFSEPVIGFTSDDIDLSQSTTGGDLTATVKPGSVQVPNSYLVSVTGMTSPGSVVATVKLDSVTDRALNDNAASTSTGTDNQIAWTPPTNPTITAHLSSAHPRSRYGWYRTPVTVHFICTIGSAPIVDGCPTAATLTTNGAAVSLHRTIVASDGGTATVRVQVKIDRVKPTIMVKGVKPGHHYPAPGPKLRCTAHDALSGLVSCKVHSSRHGHHRGYRVVATDRAGNIAVKTGTYRVG